jgi:hypothetical protein
MQMMTMKMMAMTAAMMGEREHPEQSSRATMKKKQPQ